ncbi:carbohydrate sulfotransferase 6-like [Montipora capricornis]|uniref:carbohydrate sulfotransferase 6-like n=1 Tax=Montipora foliosa TaxID=591990 RepID=UPI0035F1977B
MSVRSLRDILAKRVKPSSSPVWLVALLVLCAIFVLTRDNCLEAMRLRNRQLRSSTNSDESRRLRYYRCGANDEFSDENANNSSVNQMSNQGKNCSNLNRDIDLLRKKLAMYEKLDKFLEFDSLASKFGSKMRQNILIISDYASGSSFLGEILNQHPQIFYLYEPLKSLQYYRENRPESVYDTMVTHLLNGIFHCNFMDLVYYTEFLSYQYSSLRHRLGSRALSSPPLCPENHNNPHYSIRMCAPLRPQGISAICRLHKHTVVKTIRINSIHKLSYLMDTEAPMDYSLKVVHLVRDPRAVLNSLVMDNSGQNWTIKSVREHAQTMCRDMLRNVKYAVSAPSWLHGRYTLLRYEDLAMNPHQIAEQLYRFVGVGLAPQVRSWIDRTLREGFSANSLLDSVYRQFSYSAQNLTESVQKWRSQIPYSVARLIEMECYEVMNLLGYKFVEDEDELRTVSFPLTD